MLRSESRATVRRPQNLRLLEGAAREAPTAQISLRQQRRGWAPAALGSSALCPLSGKSSRPVRTLANPAGNKPGLRKLLGIRFKKQAWTSTVGLPVPVPSAGTGYGAM